MAKKKAGKKKRVTRKPPSGRQGRSAPESGPSSGAPPAPHGGGADEPAAPVSRARPSGPSGKTVSHEPGTRRSAVPPSETAAQSAVLEELRKKIDRLDAKLVTLLNERARLVVEVGQLKRGTGIPIYAPHREAQVLERVLRTNQGPLSDRTIEGVYREIMSGSFALEQPLRIGYLGPPGSHSHAASVKQFGSSVEFEDLRAIAGVFTEVRRGHVNYGLVPIENSTGGGIAETLDAFQEHAGQVSIYAEVQYAVHHALLSNVEPKEIRRIHSKPEVFSQCREWLSTQYPNAELLPASSSSAAVKTALEEFNQAVAIGVSPASAAIGNELASELYGLKLLFPRIEDRPDNVTRFLVISMENARPSGKDKTSVMFTTEDKPGALSEVLGVFHNSGINLSYLNERPSGRGNWTYTFFIDLLGHRDDDAVAAALQRAGAHCRELTVLGSYPRSERVL